MRIRFGGVALCFAFATAVACGVARGDTITESYTVGINTSSLAPGSGIVEFQTGITDDPGPGTVDTVQISNLNFGTQHYTQGYQYGTITDESRGNFTMSLDDASSNYAENDFDLDLYTQSITFAVTLTGPDLLGDNPNTYNSFFVLLLINSSGDQVLFDSNYDTVGITAESSGPVTDNDSAASINQIVPEPSCLLLAVLPIALLRRRRHRQR